MKIKNIKHKVILLPEQTEELSELLLKDLIFDENYYNYVMLIKTAFELGASLEPQEQLKKIPALLKKEI